jgi:hypothetical protein
MNPYERAEIVSNQYGDWRVKNAYLGLMHGSGRLSEDIQRLPALARQLHHRSGPKGYRPQDRRFDD